MESGPCSLHHMWGRLNIEELPEISMFFHKIFRKDFLPDILREDNPTQLEQLVSNFITGV